MDTPQQTLDWREGITESKNTIKVRDGEIVKGYFRDEGIPRPSEDYGNSIAFAFQKDGETEVKTWYVKANNFSLLGQIKQLGSLTGIHVQITRIGSKKSDTRYSIKKID